MSRHVDVVNPVATWTLVLDRYFNRVVAVIDSDLFVADWVVVGIGACVTVEAIKKDVIHSTDQILI